MTRIIVESIDQMPGEARDGLPLGCVLETDGPNGPCIITDAEGENPDDCTTHEHEGGPRVVAFGQGSTFSKAGLEIIAPTLMTFVANFGDNCEEPEEIRATDIRAALQWLRRHYCGSFNLHVEGASIYLGEFECERAEDHAEGQNRLDVDELVRTGKWTNPNSALARQAREGGQS